MLGGGSMFRHELHQTNPHEIYLLSLDYDNVLRPGDEYPAGIRRQAFAALNELTTSLERAPIVSGVNTGRALPDLMTDITAAPNQMLAAANGMSFHVTSVGTALHRRHPEGFLADPTWPVVEEWNPVGIRQLMDSRTELRLQTGKFTQSTYKTSYEIIDGRDREHDAYVQELTAVVAGLAAQVVFSAGKLVDFLPQGINKGTALGHEARHITSEFGKEPYVIAVDDSMNGRDVLRMADLAIIPDNAEDSLKAWMEVQTADPKSKTTYYLAHTPFAGGLLEGLRRFDIL
jgi:hypothetical protein